VNDPNENVSVLSSERVIPKVGFGDDGIAAITPPRKLAGGITVGPNPASLGNDRGINIFYDGKRIINGDLLIYDAMGNVVNRVRIGSWDMTDAKGRRVSAGAYLFRGVIVGSDGKRERVSAVVRVK